MRPILRLSLALLLAFLGLARLPAPAARAAAGPVYAGWAMEAYPDLSLTDFLSTFERMRAAGANIVWLGHSNPADVNPSAAEVGLAYPVYAAAIDPSDPQHEAALAILEAQRRALEAARTVGLKVVLPVNYRTQMGAAWNAAHGDSLRRGPDGAVLDFGGVDASPYAGDFRADTAAYYRWVDQTFVAPYRDVIALINLADEPSGVDYSSPADATFAALTGYHFADVGSDPERVARLGAFQTHVMVDFAIWAAQQWQEIDPAVPVTMSFDGGPGRKNQQAPALEPLFRDTPPNFQPAWDAYLRDGTAADALDDSEVTALVVFAGTLGHLSARYQRPYWLWSAGNSWGLGQQSDDPDTIADALVNLRLLADVSREAGGLLRGIAVWSYNLRGQGLYNNPHPTTYAPDDLFNRLSASFPTIRGILQGPPGPGPDALILAPAALPERLLGGERIVDIWKFRGYNFGDLLSLVRSGLTPAVVSTLDGEQLSGVRLLVVLARGPDDLTPGDVAALRAYRAAGGTLVDAESVDGPLALGAQWVAPGNAAEILFGKDVTATQAGPVAALGLPRLANSFVIRGPGEVLAYGGTATDPPGQMRAWVRLIGPARVIAYAPDGQPDDPAEIGPGLVGVPTQRHTFAVLVGTATPVVARTSRLFPETGFRVDNDTIWDYFVHRGGVATFGYPVSRPFRLQGFIVQIFQRRVIQLDAAGHPRLLNLLDPGLLPYRHFNGVTLPSADPALVRSAPNPTDASAVLAFVQTHAPDTFAGQPVGFFETFRQTVSTGTALPAGGDPGLVLGFDLEMWGLPTSQPMVDPNNHAFIFLRFQRGIMHYDASCGCTRGLLLGDYLKSILTGRNLPPDLEQEARNSPLYRQYDPSAPHWVRDPSLLPGTDLTYAFERQ
ncbi:MAG: hypothetical protein IRY83_01380 [Chloroflexi bacterium]|nr:hypothetical protein [Chloroflexota bacterium]